jgi:hypothetical protein
MLALFNLGGGEIILILVLTLMVAVPVAVVAGVVFLVVHANKRKRGLSPSAVTPEILPARP